MSVFHNISAIFAAVYFFLCHKRLKGCHIGFPLYFYFALFPYRFYIAGREITDSFLKVLLFIELFLVLRDAGWKLKIYLYPILLVIIIAICGVVASSYSPFFVSESFLTGIVNIIFIMFVLLLFVNRVKSKEDMEAIFECMYRNGVFLSICAVIEKYIFNQPRVKFSMSNANHFAFYLAIVFCLALYHKKKRFLIPILLYGIYLSKSGSVMLGLVMCGCVYFLSGFMTKKTLAYLIMIMLPVISVVVLLLIGGGSYTKYGTITSLIAWKDSARIGIWRDGLNDFQMKPLFGYGYNCWLSHSTPYIYVTHNDFLRIMVDCGVVGIIAFGFGWLCITPKIVKSENAILYLSLMSVVGIFSCLHNNLNSYMCWLVIILVLFDKFICRGEEHPGINFGKVKTMPNR